MVTKFSPKPNKVYFINQYTLFHILEGNGVIQVDFNNYLDWDNKLIFLEKGQYIKFNSDTFTVRKIVFGDEKTFQNKDVRVLFKHLVSLGYINYQECDACQKYLTETVFSSPKDIIDISVNQWYWQNPFNANQEEYQVIFDLKEVIDQQFKSQLSVPALTQTLQLNNQHIHHLVKEKVGLTVKNLLTQKQIIESKKDIAFSDKTIQSIAFDYGYKDPSYFNRIFKNKTGVSPGEFRDQFGHSLEDSFEQELFQLLKEFHTVHRQTAFYADKMFMTEKTFSKKVKDKFNVSIGQLIRHQIIKTARQLLQEGIKVKEVAFTLGFEEANHFSAFFKHYTQQTPTEFLSKKVP
ncbi:MAG TPA: AraC family transcriptional regulator [Microscillaceae bacterium]|nr:AraC family transcriptional regulator [Microscillaceae bacterium]